MSWKVRALTIGLAWIVVPWTWGITAQQLRRRSRTAAGSEDGSPDPVKG